MRSINQKRSLALKWFERLKRACTRGRMRIQLRAWSGEKGSEEFKSANERFSAIAMSNCFVEGTPTIQNEHSLLR